MDKKETYLWGTLLALVREQLSAIEKHVQGSLGMWGKARFGSRNKAIQKFFVALLERKAISHGDMAVDALRSDLEFIENDKPIWDDITAAEIDYVRSIMESDEYD